MMAPHDALSDRVRAEFLEMPGMTLTVAQVARLCGIDRSICAMVLDALVAAEFLSVKPDGAYARVSADMAHRARPVKATLDSHMTSQVRQRAS